MKLNIKYEKTSINLSTDKKYTSHVYNDMRDVLREYKELLRTTRVFSARRPRYFSQPMAVNSESNHLYTTSVTGVVLSPYKG